MSWGPRPSPIHPTLPWVLHAINNCFQKSSRKSRRGQPKASTLYLLVQPVP